MHTKNTFTSRKKSNIVLYEIKNQYLNQILELKSNTRLLNSYTAKKTIYMSMMNSFSQHLNHRFNSVTWNGTKPHLGHERGVGKLLRYMMSVWQWVWERDPMKWKLQQVQVSLPNVSLDAISICFLIIYTRACSAYDQFFN